MNRHRDRNSAWLGNTGLSARAAMAGLLLAGALSSAAQEGPSPPEPRSLLYLTAPQAAAQRDFERGLNAVADAQRLRAWHDMLASEPHVAGTPGDQRVIDAIAAACRDMGLEVQVHEFWPLLSAPIDAQLAIIEQREDGGIVGEDRTGAAPTSQQPARRGVVPLPITEDNLLSDPFVAHPGLSFGWNAYSGSGDVTAGVVYANYGTREDFETLKKCGIDCAGKIVLTRYGGNFRGYKAKYAEDAGAVGLIIYTDPDDSGYRKGVTWPEGGWANDTCIQRGSIIAQDQPGDPLTPGIAARQDAPRLDMSAVDLPRIPVQPIGYRAAQQIMQRMTGMPLPEDLIASWQGGLPCAYRLTGGDNLQLRLMVRQERAIRRTANVIATLRGESQPEQRVIIGSHHDAWGFGAGDPTSGTMVVLEAARSFSEMAKRGRRPARSIDFCFWGAEEFGVIGSTEYCEEHADQLRRDAVAYINLDGAAMGPKFSASSDPLLKTLIEEATREVPQPRERQTTVHEAWLKNSNEQKSARQRKGQDATTPTDDRARNNDSVDSNPSIGTLGGGSDHVGFYCHLGIPSCFISAGGAPGTAYHSNYDNLAWYRRTVGEDYEPGLMLTRVTNVMAARLANSAIPPLDPARFDDDLREHVRTLAERARERDVQVDLAPLNQAIDRLRVSSARSETAIEQAFNRGSLTPDQEGMLSACVQTAARAWQPNWPAGLPGRSWFRNTWASSDPYAGYASWMLPALRGAIEQGDSAAAQAAVAECAGIIDALAQALDRCAAAMPDQVGDVPVEASQ